MHQILSALAQFSQFLLRDLGKVSLPPNSQRARPASTLSTGRPRARMGGGASKRLASERQRVRFVWDVRAACVCSVERRSAARSVFAPCAGDARGGATADAISDTDAPCVPWPRYHVQLEAARQAINSGHVEAGIEIMEALRGKLIVPGKGVKKGFQDLFNEVERTLADAEKAQDELCVAHGEARQLMKRAEELLDKGERINAREDFEEAIDRWQAAVKASQFAEQWAPLLRHEVNDSGPQWSVSHESMSIEGPYLICEESDVGSAKVKMDEAVDSGKLVCEIRIKSMKTRPEGEDSDIFFGVMRNHIGLDAFWYEDEFEDEIWFYSDDGDICTGEEVLEDVASSWAYKEGDSIRLELQFTDGEEGGVLKFFKNGVLIPQHFTGVEGPVVPAVLMSDCQEGDCIELVDLEYEAAAQDRRMGEIEDKTDVLHEGMPIFIVIDAFLSSSRANVQFIDFQEEQTTTTVSMAKTSLARATLKLQKVKDEMRCDSNNSKRMELTSKLKSDYLQRANAYLEEAEALVERGKLTESFQIFDSAIAVMKKVEEPGMLKAAKKARAAAVARCDLSLRNADRMMKLVRTRIKSEVLAVLFEGYEEVSNLAEEAVQLFREAGETAKANDALVTKAVCDDLQRASACANSGTKALENARISGVQHHFQQAYEIYSEASAMCSNLGNKVFAEELKRLGYEAMAGYEAVRVEEEQEIGDDLEDIENAMDDYADMLDGKSDREEQDAGGSVEPCLTGVVSRRILAPSKCFSVYVSSSLSENQPERLALAREVACMVREAVLCFGFEFEFVDPFFAVRNAQDLTRDFEYRDKATSILKQCQKESAGIDFLILLGGDDNGLSFPGKTDFETFGSLIKCIPDRGELGKLRKVIIEWFKVDTNSNPRKYVILDRKKKIPNLASIDDKKLEIGREEWNRQFAQLQQGFYEGTKIQISLQQMQKIRVGMLRKLGGITSQNMKRKCYELFCEIDVDGSGQIDVDELRTAFEQLDAKLTEKEVKEFMDEFDEDRSGEIGFDEFLLIVEKLLLDAKNHEKDDLIQSVDHAKYFMQSLIYQDACDGILDRPRDEALERSAAVLWGFDPMQLGQELLYFEEGDEFAIQDSAAAMRRANISSQGAKALEKHAGARPEWFQHVQVWELKEMVFAKLVEMEEYMEENPPDDTVTPESVGSRPRSQESGVLMLDSSFTESSLLEAPNRSEMGTFPPPPTGSDMRIGSATISFKDGAASDQFGGRRIDPEVWNALSQRKSSFLKALSDWEFMRVVSRLKTRTLPGSSDSPFVIVQPPEMERTGEEGTPNIQETIERMRNKIQRLTESERRERNSMTRAKMQEDIRRCEECVQCLQADLDRSMFIVLKGNLEVYVEEAAREDYIHSAGTGRSGSSKPPTAEKTRTGTKVAELQTGDAFGDLTLVLGMPRDTRIQSVTPVELAVINFDMVESLMIRNPQIVERVNLLVDSLQNDKFQLQSQFLTRAAFYDEQACKRIMSAMAVQMSPLFKVLTPKEVDNLAKIVLLSKFPKGVTLFKQDDSQDAGWGPFGDSAFLLIEGELSVSIVHEGGENSGKSKEVARAMSLGESVGDMNLVTGAARTSTVMTETNCLLAEITRDQLTSVLQRDIRQQLMSLMANMKTAQNVEARVLSQRVQHAMRLRHSTLLKQLKDIELDFLASVAVIRIEDKGTLITEQDEWGDSCFVVLRGELRVLVAFSDSEDLREIGRLKTGDVFGEMTLLLDYPRSSTVEVISKQVLLAEITRDNSEKLLGNRPDIMDSMEMMVHGDQGLDDIMRARTPLGGRAATPGGVVAEGLKTSISCVSFPWKTEPKGMHAELRGKKYINVFVQKVANAVLERIEPALIADAQVLQDPMRHILLECSWHLDLAARHTEVFAGRSDEMKRLLDHIQGDYQQRMGLKNQPLILIGDNGVGKSTLLAMAGIRAKRRNPGAVVVYRFVGWSHDSMNARSMVKSVVTQLMTIFGMKVPPKLPDRNEELREMLVTVMSKATKQEMITLLIDAADDLDYPTGFMPSFEWLPRVLPRHSSIIMSMKASASDHISVLNSMFTGEVYFNVYALRPTDAPTIIDGYLEKRNKPGFATGHYEAIKKASLESAGLVGVPLNCSGLFLRLCMDLSESWISFNPAPPLPPNISDLTSMVIDEMEKEHGQVLVERALTYICTARDGLVWQELTDLLSCDDDVLDEVYGPVIPQYRTMPSFKAKLLSKDLDRLVDGRFNNEVQTQKFACSIYHDVVFQRYGLTNTVRQCSFHRALAMYFCGEWHEGKEILHLKTNQWKPVKDDAVKYDRGINPQQTFVAGQSRLFFHRRKLVANMRKIRELPHHICWSSGRSPDSIDAVSRALSQRPPSAWNDRSESDRNAELMFLRHFCRLDVVEAACLSGYAYELHDEMLLAKKVFPYSELVRQFHKLAHESVETLAGAGHLTFQCALNSAGNGQNLINAIAQDMLKLYHQQNVRDNIPDIWFVHTNKDEVMDSLYVKFEGHWGAAFHVTISNMDDIVMTCGADCSVRLYDATSGNEVKRIDGHVEAVLKVNFSPTNKKIVSCSADMTAIVWNLLTGQQVARLQGHEGQVLDAIFLDNDVVVTASNDSTMRTWNVDTGQVIKIFKGHQSAVTCLVSLAKGIQIISSSLDKTIRIWDSASGSELLSLSGHDGVIYNLDLSRDQRKLLSCGSDQFVKVWDLDEGLEIETLHLHESAVTACAFDPTGNWVVTGGLDKTVRIFQLASSGDAVIVGEHQAAVCCIKFSNNGEFILSAGNDGVVSKWEWAIAHQVATDSTPDHTAPICHVEFSNTGKHCISLSVDGVSILRVLDWRCCTLAAHQLTDAKDPASAVKFAPNGLTVASLHAFGCLLWDTKTGSLVGRFGQIFNLHSMDFPDEVHMQIAPPLSPLLQPDDFTSKEEGASESAKNDSTVFNQSQAQILKSIAEDRHRKRFRSDFVAIAKELDQLDGGRGVDWRDVRDELAKMMKEEEERIAYENQKQLEDEVAAAHLQKQHEAELLRLKSQAAKKQAAAAIEKYLMEFLFCESCGMPWVKRAKACANCGYAGPTASEMATAGESGQCEQCLSVFRLPRDKTTGARALGKCKKCNGEWRVGSFCHKCGAVRKHHKCDSTEQDSTEQECADQEGTAELKPVEEDTSNDGDTHQNLVDTDSSAASQMSFTKHLPRSSKRGAEGLFEDGAILWFHALRRIVSGVDTEIDLVKSLVQADHDTLSHGKLNAEIAVFGREMTAAEREAFGWHVDAEASRNAVPFQVQEAGNSRNEDVNAKENGEYAAESQDHAQKQHSDSTNLGSDANGKPATNDLKKMTRAESKVAAAARSAELKAKAMAQEALLKEMLQVDSEIAVFGEELQGASGLKWLNIGTEKPQEGEELINSSLAKQLQTPSGLRWQMLGAERPKKGEELVNAELAKALKRKRALSRHGDIFFDFDKKLWNRFEMVDLRLDHFIEVEGTFFRPADSKNGGVKTEFSSNEWDHFGIEMLRMDHFIQAGAFFFSPAATKRDVEWHGPRRKKLERQILKSKTAKRKALEDNLQHFLKTEHYGEIPAALHEKTSSQKTSKADMFISEAKPVEKNPDKTTNSHAQEPQTAGSIVFTKGLALWMGGIAKILTGPKDEADVVKQLLLDDKAKLALMKANAEVGVFGRELTEKERATAWGNGPAENLVFLKPSAEIAALGHDLPREDREEAWTSGPNKKKLASSLSKILQNQKYRLSRALQSIQDADELLYKAASRPTSAAQSLRTDPFVESNVPMDAACRPQTARSDGPGDVSENFVYKDEFLRTKTPFWEAGDEMHPVASPRSLTKKVPVDATTQHLQSLSLSAATPADAHERFQSFFGRADPVEKLPSQADASNLNQGNVLDRNHLHEMESPRMRLGTAMDGKVPAEILRLDSPQRIESPEHQHSKDHLSARSWHSDRSISARSQKNIPDSSTRGESLPQSDYEQRENHSIVRFSGGNFGGDNGENSDKVETEDAVQEDASLGLQQMETDRGAEVLRLSTAAPSTAERADTAGSDQDGPDVDALQRRISLYTDVDVEVVEGRPGTSVSVVSLRPRTGASRPKTGDVSRPQTGRSGSSAGLSRPDTDVVGSRPQTSVRDSKVGPVPTRSDKDQSSDDGRPVTSGSVNFAEPLVSGEGNDSFNTLNSGQIETFQDINEDEIDENDVDLTVTHDTALWTMHSLLSFIEQVDPKKLELEAKKEAEAARRAKLKADARKRKKEKEETEEKEEKEVYDADKPEAEIDVEIVQQILFTLDQLEATTNPKSHLYGKAAEVLAKIGNERICRRNIAFPARGIPSLNFLVIETIKPYLTHPDKAVRLQAIDCLTNIARPGDEKANAVLKELMSEQDEEIKNAAMVAISAIASADDADDEEDMKNPLVRKMLTITVMAANGIAAADASGLSDPFATLAMQTFDADIDHIKTMRAQKFGSAKELVESDYATTLADAPSMIDSALKLMQLKRALLFEMTSAWDHKELMKDCQFVTLEKSKILFVQGDSDSSLYMVIGGTARVLVKFDPQHTHQDEENGLERSQKKPPIAGKHDLGQQVALLDRGDTIGEMSLILQEDASCSVVADTDCNFLKIPRDALLGLKKRKPSVTTDIKIRAMKQKGLLLDDKKPADQRSLRKTDVKHKTLEPVWRETFQYYNIDIMSSLVVSIFDHDIVGSHDFLGRVLLEIQSLPLNQDVDQWYPLEARSEEDVVTGSLHLKIRLQADKRPRIVMQDGETFVTEVHDNELQLLRDSSTNDVTFQPETVFRASSKIGACHVCPADPRNVVVGDQDGHVCMLRVQDVLNYKWECDVLEELAEEQEQSRIASPDAVIPSPDAETVNTRGKEQEGQGMV